MVSGISDTYTPIMNNHNRVVPADRSEQTWLFGRGAIKRQDLKEIVLDRGLIESCCNGQYGKDNVFFKHLSL